MIDKNEIAARLKAAVQAAGGNSAVSERAEVPLRTLNSYLNGEAEPKLSIASAIAVACGTTLDALLLAESAGSQVQLPASPEVAVIPLLNVEAAAGAGRSNHNVEVIDRLPFSRTILKQLGVKPEHAHFIKARGDSMEPTIADGAIVLIDASIRRIRDDGIYALVVDGDVRLKRVQKSTGGKLTLISDNGRYPDEKVSSTDTLRVEGKVFWTGSGL